MPQPTEAAVKQAGTITRAQEARLNLLRHLLDGWCVWPLLRMRATYALYGTASAMSASATVSYSRRELWGLALRDLARLACTPQRCRIVIVTSSSYRTEKAQGRPKDCLFDDHASQWDDVIKIERINSRILFEQNEQSVCPSRFSDAALNVLGSALHSRLPVAADVRRLARELTDDLHQYPAWRVFSYDAICQQLSAFRRQRRVWCAWFSRLGASVVLTDDGYNSHHVIAAARASGAQVVELQHGAFFESGPEYCWSEYAVAHRQWMPVPDRLLVYGQHWGEILGADSFWGDRVRIVGSQRIDEYRRRRSTRQTDGCLLVFTTQGVSQPGIAKWVADLLSHTKDWSGLRVVIKLHPVADFARESYLSMLPQDARLKLVAGNEVPSTFELLSKADYHASISSTCHYDAVSLGARTFVLPFPSHEWMGAMVRAGHAHLPSCPAEMANLMPQHLDQPLPEAISHYYFKSGATENVAREIEALDGHFTRARAGASNSASFGSPQAQPPVNAEGLR